MKPVRLDPPLHQASDSPLHSSVPAHPCTSSSPHTGLILTLDPGLILLFLPAPLPLLLVGALLGSRGLARPPPPHLPLPRQHWAQHHPPRGFQAGGHRDCDHHHHHLSFPRHSPRWFWRSQSDIFTHIIVPRQIIDSDCCKSTNLVFVHISIL